MPPLTSVALTQSANFPELLLSSVDAAQRLAWSGVSTTLLGSLLYRPASLLGAKRTMVESRLILASASDDAGVKGHQCSGRPFYTSVSVAGQLGILQAFQL